MEAQNNEIRSLSTVSSAPLDNENQPYYIFYMTLYCILIVIGVTVNVFTIVTIVVVKELHSLVYVLIVNLAIIDMSLVVSGNIFSVLGVILGSVYFNSVFNFCQLIAAACVVLCNASIINIVILAAHQYIRIVHSNSYNKMFTKKTTILYIVMTWVIALLGELPNVLGWGGHMFDEKAQACMWNRLASRAFSVFYPATFVFMPCGLVLFFYLKIFHFVHKSTSKFKGAAKTDQSDNMSKSFKVAKSLFSSYIAYVICWLPYGVVILFDVDNSWPYWTYSFSGLLMHAYSAINPFVYGCLNPSMRNGFKILLSKIFGEQLFNNKTAPSNNTATTTT